MIASFLAPGAPRPICKGSQVAVLPRPDLWDSIRKSLITIGTAVTASPESDSGLLVELTGAGPDSGLELGTICWMNGWHVGRYVTLAQEPHWIVPSERIIAVMNSTADSLPTLRGHNVVTKADEPWMAKVVMGEDSAIHRPIADDGTIIAGFGSDPKRVAYEVVVAVGPDTELGYEVGELVAVPKDHGTTELTLHGNSYTILHEKNINCVVAVAANRGDL